MQKNTPPSPTQKGYVPPVSSIGPDDYGALITRALEEDKIENDVSTFSIFTKPQEVTAKIVAKTPGVLCGLELCRAVFSEVDPKLNFSTSFQDAQQVSPRDIVLSIQGDVRSVLRGERVALNFLSMLSGIASKVKEAVDILSPMGVALLDTRKTIPGFRRLSKYAVTTGGGLNHRHDLSQMGMIKDNHIAAAGSITRAIEMFREANGKLPCEVEIDHIEQLDEALACRAGMLLLDNMEPEELKTCVQKVKAFNEKHSTQITCEASGGYHLGNLKTLEGTGVDYVSMGALTNKITPLDFGLDM